MTQVGSPSDYGPDRRWWAFATLAVAVFISILDLFIVNIAFSSIERQWPGAGLSGLSWVLSAYAIVLAALLVPLGRVGDLVGASARSRQVSGCSCSAPRCARPRRRPGS
jgi:MFS family permease